MSESKIVFTDDDKVRVLRGVITAEDENFITLTRRDGVVRIAKRVILRIEEWKERVEEEIY